MGDLAEGPPTSNVMEVSTYSQVVFNEVPKSYPPNTHVKCSYAVTAAFEPHRRDWVGIFKVGWGTTRDYYTFVWAVPSSDPVGQHVLFDVYYLPKEDGEFYQFCYVDSSGQVRGASIPFSFESPVESSLEYSMDNDLLVITTQEQVEQVEKEKEELHRELEKQQESIEVLKAELDERLLEIRRLRESDAELRQSVDRLEQEQVRSQSEREEEREQWANQRETKGAQEERERETLVGHRGAIEELLVQHTASMRAEEELQQSVSTWQNKYERAVTKINQLKQERTELREKVVTQEADIMRLSPRVAQLEQEKQQGQDELCRLQDHIALLQLDLQSSQKETLKLAGELRGLHVQAEAAEGLRCENHALQRTLSEQEGQNREDLQKQVQGEVLASQLQEVKAELHRERQSSEEARSHAGRALRELQEEKQQIENRLKVFEAKDQLSSKLEIHLMDARNSLEEQANLAEVLQAKKEELSLENQKLRRNVEKLNEELAHLQALSPPSYISLQHPNPYSPSPVTLGTQNPASDSLLYGNPFESPATPNTEEQLSVCRYCEEVFPDISKAELDLHEESHKVCPLCTLICDHMEQREFEEHVYNHEE